MIPAVKKIVILTVSIAVASMVVLNLLDVRVFQQAATFSPKIYHNIDFRTVVEDVNEAFRADWKSAGLSPAPRADDLLIARRVSLALTGTIPSLEEIRAFEDRASEGRIQWWLSHLLEDRRYSDYLAERFARVYVGIEGGPFLVYRRHRLVSWLSDELEMNRPYDQLVRQLITAEGIWTSKPEVNFLTVTINQNNGKKGPDEVKLAGRVSRAFLGIRMDCVQCHDDMFGDRWKQEDFHQLAAFFGGAKMSITGLHDKNRKYEFRYKGESEKEPIPALVPFQRELMPTKGSRRDRLAKWITHPENEAFARTTVNRMWAFMFNRPLVDPIDDIPLDGPYPPGLAILADDLIQHRFDLQRLIRIIAATEVFQLDSKSVDDLHPVTQEQEDRFAAFPITRLRPEQISDSLIQSATLKTLDTDSHIIMRVMRSSEQNNFIKRYGDIGENEFESANGTIPQRLILMNGNMVAKRTKQNLLLNASTRIGVLAPNDAAAVDTAYLTVLTRLPNSSERDYFESMLTGTKGGRRSAQMQDIFWTLINSTEFSWNH